MCYNSSMSREQVLSDFRGGAIGEMDIGDADLALLLGEKLNIKSAGYNRMLAKELSLDDGNPNEFKPIKKVGVFIVSYSPTRYNWPEAEPDFHLSTGENVIGLALPPLKPQEKKLSQIRASFRDLATYIDLCPPSKYVMAFTYQRMAEISRRFGFTVTEIQLPEDLTNHMQSVYGGWVDRGLLRKNPGPPLLCYQRTEDFLARFAPAKHR